MFRTPLISALAAGSSRRVVRPAPAQQLWQRAFASEAAPEAEKPAEATGPRKKVIFDKTSDPKLDEIFTEMLHKIILPARLPKNKWKIISQEENAQKIETDPIVIEVEGYEHRFPILDFHHKTIPKSRVLMNDALALMKTREDWANLSRILSGYRDARRTISSRDIQRIVRLAGKTGNLYAIIDALRNVKESHFRIRTLPNADNILFHLQRLALDSDYAEGETRDANTWARMLHELMEDEEHAKRPALGRPLHREPQVVGQLLHLAAAQAVHHRGGRDDDDGAVAKLAETLAVTWPEGRNLSTIHSRPEPATTALRYKMRDEADAHLVFATSRRLSTATLILHGIGLARQVVEPGLAARLDPIAQALRAELDVFVAQRGEYMADEGWLLYDKLLGEA